MTLEEALSYPEVRKVIEPLAIMLAKLTNKPNYHITYETKVVKPLSDQASSFGFPPRDTKSKLDLPFEGYSCESGAAE